MYKFWIIGLVLALAEGKFGEAMMNDFNEEQRVGDIAAVFAIGSDKMFAKTLPAVTGVDVKALFVNCESVCCHCCCCYCCCCLLFVVRRLSSVFEWKA